MAEQFLNDVFFSVSTRPGVKLTMDAGGGVQNVAALRLTPSGNGIASTLGHTTPGDGGHGSWRWDPASTDPDDGGAVVTVANVTVGRWKRLFTGAIVVTWFGAVGDGVHDDTAAFLAAIAYMKSRGGGVLRVPAPPVAYVIQTPGYSYRANFGLRAGALTIDFSNITIEGDAGGSRMIMRTPTGGSAANNDFVLVPPWATDLGTGAPAAWQPNHSYSVAGVSVVAPNGHTYVVAAVAGDLPSGGVGTSGSFGPGDTSRATSYRVLDGTVTWTLADQVYYGQMWRLRNNSHGDPCKNVVFRNLILDGDSPRNNTLWPYATKPIPEGSVPWNYFHTIMGQTITAGEGWAAGHSPIAMDQLSQYGLVTIENCQFHNWRSEIYRSDYGQPFVDTLTIQNCWFNSFTGNAISLSSPSVLDNILITDTSQAIENDAVGFDMTLNRITIQDGGIGIVLPSSATDYVGRGRTTITNFTIQRLSAAGLFISGFSTNIRVSHGQILDVAQIPGYSGCQVVPQFGGIPTNITLDDISIGVDQRNSDDAFNINVRGTNNRGTNLRIVKTERAIANSHFIGGGYGGTVQAGSELTLSRCDYRGVVGQGNFGGAGEVRILQARLDGLFQDLHPFLDAQWFDYYEAKPGSPVSLTTPRNFPLATEVMFLLNTNVTVVNSASIALAGGVNFTPSGSGAYIWFVRASAGNQNVVETHRQALP